MNLSPERADRLERRITREVQRVAARVAQSLRAASPQGAPATAFLGALGPEEPAPDGDTAQPHAPDAHPLDRLVAGFQLTPLDVDLVLLAGMAEEHEGVAGALRALHPLGVSLV